MNDATATMLEKRILFGGSKKGGGVGLRSGQHSVRVIYIESREQLWLRCVHHEPASDVPNKKKHKRSYLGICSVDSVTPYSGKIGSAASGT